MSRSRLRRSLIILACSFLIGQAAFNSLSAQEGESSTAPPARTSFPSLHRIGSVWLGIEHSDYTDRLVLYDSTFTERSSRQWRGLNPLDVASMSGPGSDTAGFLLATPANMTLLYRVGIRTRPDLAQVWQTPGRGFSSIVGVFQPSGSTGPEVVLAGDSGVVAIGPDGTVRFSRRSKALAAFRTGGTRDEIVAVERVGTATAVSWINPNDGTVTATRQLDAGGEVLTSFGGPGSDRTELAIVTSDPPTLFRIRKESRGFQARIPLAEFPDAVVSLPEEAGTALIIRSYPAPRVDVINGTEASSELYYPTERIFTDICVTDRFLLLVARDSAVVYDSSLEYLCTVPAIGGPHPELTLLDETHGRYLLTTDRGSRIVRIEQLSFLWLRRNWELLALGTFGLLLIISGILFYRRFRFIRAVYANLVQAPGTDGVVVTTERGRVLRINQSARRLLAMTGPVPLGRHVSSYLATDDLRPVLDSVRRLLATGEPFETELNRVVENERRTLRLQGRIMSGRYGGNSGYILLLEDITSMLERDRLVNWASVAHHIAHEMKTPLGTVRTTAEVLRETMAEHPEPEKVAPALRRIVRQSVRLREIVDDLLTVARTEELKRIDADVSMLMSALIDEFSEYVPSSITLRFKREGTEFRAWVDTDQLTIAVRNLLDNARQAIGERDAGEIGLTLHEETEHIRIVVTDNGIGMSKSTLDRLFQPYYTEKEGGSGIGTVIIKRVIEGHGGTVVVESEPGHGTTFILTIPRVSDDDRDDTEA